MKNLKIKASTIARIGALLVVLVNQCLALFGKGALPFTESMAYQILSLAATVVVAAINCWYNNDVTKVARIAGKVLESFDDGKLTEEEIESIVEYAEKEESSEDAKQNAFLIGFANGILKNLKTKVSKKNNKEDK